MPLWNAQQHDDSNRRPQQSLQSQQHYPEHTPLRRRENDAMQSPGHHQHHYAGTTTTTTNNAGAGGHYSTANHGSNHGNRNTGELPRSWNSRGRGNRHTGLKSKSSLLQWTMRAVLASPVLVLVLWSVISVVFHRNLKAADPQQQQQLMQGSVVSKHPLGSSGTANIAAIHDLQPPPPLGGGTGADITVVYREFPAAGESTYREFPAAGESTYREFPAAGTAAENRDLPVQGKGVPAYNREQLSKQGETLDAYHDFPAAGAKYREFPAAGTAAENRDLPLEGAAAEGAKTYHAFQAQGTAAENRDLPLEGSTTTYFEFPAASTAAENRDLPLEGSTEATNKYRVFQAQGTAAENRDLPLEGSAARQLPAQGTGFIERVEEAGEGVLEVMETALGKAGSNIPLYGPLGKGQAGTGQEPMLPPAAGLIPVIGPLGSSNTDSEQRLIVQPPAQGAAPSWPGFQKSRTAATPGSMLQSQPATGSTGTNANSKKQNVQVYYYDPAQAVGPNGQLVVPSIVYDQTGRAVETLALGAREILVEQPPLGVTPIRNSTGNSTSTTTTWVHPNVISGRIEHKSSSKSMNRLGSISSAMVAGQNAANGSNTPLADQSIIIGTVGVMALLVGAITARRLRSRNILSACIENESLEDDIAYDTAYTINSDSYNTFSQGWKGDLEKFDV